MIRFQLFHLAHCFPCLRVGMSVFVVVLAAAACLLAEMLSNDLDVAN